MKWFVLLLTVFAQGFLSAKGVKRQLKVLIAADTTTKNISPGSIADVDRMKKSFQGIAAQTGLRLRLTILQNTKLTPEHIGAWVRSLSSSDISFCYYTGHGVRLPEITNQWPCIVLPATGLNKARAIPGSVILKAIKKRHPRLAIVFFDCCNRPVTAKTGEPTDFNKQLIIRKTPALPGLKTLFLKAKGIIATCAATRGEAALTVVRASPQGGLFTTGFLATLHHVGRDATASWPTVLGTTGEVCAKLANGTQHPFFNKIK